MVSLTLLRCSFYSWCCIHCVFVLGEHCKCACMLCGLCIVWGVCVYACFFAWGQVCGFVVWRWVCVWRLLCMLSGGYFLCALFCRSGITVFYLVIVVLFWLLIYGWELFIPIKIFLFIPLFLCCVFFVFKFIASFCCCFWKCCSTFFSLLIF